MRTMRSVFGETTHVWHPEVLIAGVLAAVVLIGAVDRFSVPTPADPACSSTPGNRAQVLCAVRGDQNWTLPGRH
jgi:hypothetical protein